MSQLPKRVRVEGQGLAEVLQWPGSPLTIGTMTVRILATGQAIRIWETEARAIDEEEE